MVERWKNTQVADEPPKRYMKNGYGGKRTGAGHPPGVPGGRPLGSKNRVPKLIKDALLEAAVQLGEDGRGKDELVGFFKMAARKELKSFLTAMTKIIPLQITGKNDQPIQVVQLDETMLTSATAEELQALQAILSRLRDMKGLPPPQQQPVHQIEASADDYAVTLNH